MVAGSVDEVEVELETRIGAPVRGAGCFAMLARLLEDRAGARRRELAGALQGQDA